MKAGRKKVSDRSDRRLLEMYYSPEQVSLATGLHRKTILQLAKDGTLGECKKPFPNKVLIPASGVNAWLDEHPLDFWTGRKEEAV